MGGGASKAQEVQEEIARADEVFDRGKLEDAISICKQVKWVLTSLLICV